MLKHLLKTVFTIDKEKQLWLRNKVLGEKVDVEKIYDSIDKEIKGKFETKNPINEKIKKYKKIITIKVEKFVYLYGDIIIPKIMSCRVSTLEAIKFRSRLEHKQHDIILCKEQSVISKITKLFPNEKILLKQCFEL